MEWDATIEGQRIRDDAAAMKAWYRFVPGAAKKEILKDEGVIQIDAIEERGRKTKAHLSRSA